MIFAWTARRLTAVAAVLLVAAVAVAQAAALTVPQWRLVLTVVCLMVLDVLGALFGLRAARSGRNRVGWVLVSMARLASVEANTALGLGAQEGLRGLYLAGAVSALVMYVLLGVGAFAFPAQRLRRGQRAALVSEAVAVLGCGLIFIWKFVLEPHLATGTNWALRWPVVIGFPIGDLVLLIGISAVVLRGGLNAGDRPTGLLMAGMGLYLLSDAAFNAAGTDGMHAVGPVPATVSVVAASLCMTLAAMWAAATSHAGRPVQRPLTAAWFSYIPYAAVVLGLGLMVVVMVHDRNFVVWAGYIIGLVLMTGAVTVRQVISLRESSEQQIVDALTGLSSREGLERRGARALRRGETVAGLFIDLDGFKAVNDAYGHAAGDLVLMEVARTLRSNVRGTDVVARVGGDEFFVVQRDVTGPADAIALARRVLSIAAARPVTIGDHTVVVRMSIGIAVAAPGDTLDDLRRHADIAIYQAKRTASHSFAVYEPGMLDRRRDDELLGRDLDDAVSGEQLEVHYQPMIDLATGRPTGAEALVRWRHPVRGMVSPLDFIAVAERTGIITEIGLHVLEQACRQVLAWHRSTGRDDLYVSVNVSPRQLQERGLAADILAVLDRERLDPRRLVLEVTESAIVDDRTAIPTLRALRAHGIRIAIDDFGTGYSSLQYLTRLPVDILKVDRSFVAEITGEGHGSAVTEAVIRLAQALELSTVAEGIETTTQADRLRQLGCRTGQGYLYAKPMPSEDALAYFTRADGVAGALDHAGGPVGLHGREA
ncbi:putative bifunctional diguanylate cyclase/phosphodiesterase [Actinoplanes sp. RD1]|uniref:putative bifunctional diguanylate cyclase/phosphodiesterase n=1 Tax=Actinoplanes sp. RD1 TaxID=3064538 RepID=UPI00274285CC|nr:bifunctional diguanylate cyclase/phosphodiesterase [Actinoplanes sp. RD1]